MKRLHEIKGAVLDFISDLRQEAAEDPSTFWLCIYSGIVGTLTLILTLVELYLTLAPLFQ